MKSNFLDNVRVTLMIKMPCDVTSSVQNTVIISCLQSNVWIAGGFSLFVIFANFPDKTYEIQQELIEQRDRPVGVLFISRNSVMSHV